MYLPKRNENMCSYKTYTQLLVAALLLSPKLETTQMSIRIKKVCTSVQWNCSGIPRGEVLPLEPHGWTSVILPEVTGARHKNYRNYSIPVKLWEMQANMW